MNLCEVLLRQARDRPDAVAIIEPHTPNAFVISFAGLEERTARGARLLLDHGLRRGERVLILQPISIELYVALLSVLRLGLVVTLIDPSAGRGHLAASLERAQPNAFIGSVKANLLRLVSGPLRRLRPAFSTGVAWPGVISWRKLEALAPLTDVAPSQQEDDALITFTSGSTGLPKAAVRSHGFLLAQHAALARAIDLVPGEVDLATLPVFVLANLASGVTTLLPDADLRRPGSIDPEPVLRQLDSMRPTRTVGSPAFYERLLTARDDTPHPLACLDKLFTGGAPVFPRLLRRVQEAMPQGRVVAVYGSTEAEPIAHVDWRQITEPDLERMYAGGGLLAGHPVPEVELRIASFPKTTGESVPRFDPEEFEALCLSANEPGEIVVHGPHVIQSYLGGVGDEETKFQVGRARWHRTGDAGYLDDTGRLWLLGRASAVIEDEHGLLHPFSVECAASRFGWVRRSALVTRDGRRLLAVELARDSDRIERVESGRTLEALEGALAWARLDRIVQVPRIPVDRRHNAKVDYVALENILDRSK